MGYLCRYELAITKKKIEEICNKKEYKTEQFPKIVFLNEEVIDKTITYDLIVRRNIRSYKYRKETSKHYLIEEEEVEINDKIQVTFFLDYKIVMFNSKNKAKEFGIAVLNEVLFKEKVMEILKFNLKDIEEDAGKGNFKNIWFVAKKSNKAGVNSEVLYGENIDDVSDKEGIGIHYNDPLLNRYIKIQITKQGVLNAKLRCSKLRDWINFHKSVFEIFLAYSNLNEEFKEYIQKIKESRITLEDYGIETISQTR